MLSRRIEMALYWEGWRVMRTSNEMGAAVAAFTDSTGFASYS